MIYSFKRILTFILVMSEQTDYLNLDDQDIEKLLLELNVFDSKVTDTKNQKKKESKCISCHGTNLFLDHVMKYKVCNDCGVINEEILDDNPNFVNESGSSRYGCPSNFYFPKSALGTKIKAKGYNRISNLQKQGQMPYKEKSLMEVLKRIQARCKKYKISPPIIDNAKNLYKKINDCKHTKGKRKGKTRIMRCINRLSMIAACLFYACKLENEPRSPKEIADIYDLEVKHVNRGCRKFLDYIDLGDCKFKSSTPSDFIERFGSKLDIDEKYIKIAKDMASNITKLKAASTHEPPSVAAGCFLLVSNLYHLGLTKSKISKVFNDLSDVTISKTYRRIYPLHKIILHNKITDMIVERRNNSTNNISINATNLVKKKVYLSDSEETSSETNILQL